MEMYRVLESVKGELCNRAEKVVFSPIYNYNIASEVNGKGKLQVGQVWELREENPFINYRKLTFVYKMVHQSLRDHYFNVYFGNPVSPNKFVF